MFKTHYDCISFAEAEHTRYFSNLFVWFVSQLGIVEALKKNIKTFPQKNESHTGLVEGGVDEDRNVIFWVINSFKCKHFSLG